MDASEIVASYNAFIDAITDFGLQDQVDSKPLLNVRLLYASFRTVHKLINIRDMKSGKHLESPRSALGSGKL